MMSDVESESPAPAAAGRHGVKRKSTVAGPSAAVATIDVESESPTDFKAAGGRRPRRAGKRRPSTAGFAGAAIMSDVETADEEQPRVPWRSARAGRAVVDASDVDVSDAEAQQGRQPLSTDLIPPGGDAGGRIVEGTLHEVRDALSARCGHGRGCWSSLCKLKCKEVARRNLMLFSRQLLTTTNCTPVARDMVLFDLLQPSQTLKGGRGQCAYQLAGVRLCKLGLSRVLGIGQKKAARVRAGKHDNRFGPSAAGHRGPRSQAWSDIYSHLWHTYESVAEFPAHVPMVIGGHDGPAHTTTSASREVKAFLAEVSREGCFGAAGAAVLQPDDDLPRKVLPPGCPKDHWWSFLGAGNERYHRCYSTFKRVWRGTFAAILTFATFATHPACSVCSELKAGIRTAGNMAQKVARAELYSEHLRGQWEDRHVYWRARSLSRLRDGGWLCMMWDGADQAKFRVLKAATWPSEFEGQHRPKLQVVGCLAHGYECSFNLREEDVDKGSDFTLEVLARAIDRVFRECDAAGRERPRHLWLQSDNTSAENKHQWTARFAALMVDRGVFDSVVDGYLRPGHTHEDLDSIFGVMSGHIGKQLSWNAPQDMIEHIQRKMATYLAPLRVVTGLVGEVRGWCDWLAPLDEIKVKGGVTGYTQKGSSGFFAYCRRKDVPPEFAHEVRPEPCMDPNDVVFLEKEFMSSPHLRQPIFTFCRAGQSWRLERAPVTWRPRSTFSQTYVDDLNDLALKVMRHFPEKGAAVQYLRHWLGNPRQPATPPPTPLFLQQPPRRNPCGLAVGEALAAATMRSTKVVAVHRRGKGTAGWTAAANLIHEVPLHTWIAYRESVGSTAEDATSEWVGARRVLGATRTTSVKPPTPAKSR